MRQTGLCCPVMTSCAPVPTFCLLQCALRPYGINLATAAQHLCLCRNCALPCDTTRVTSNLQLSLQGTLRPEEIKQLMSSAHRPNYILLVLSELIEHTDIVTPERFRMDQNLTFLHDAHGACERLLKTPIPLSYTR